MFKLEDLLAPERTLCKESVVSKKKLFEIAADLICADQGNIESGEIYNKLLARERLGSTALGGGIAIPHSRISNCENALGCLISLDQGIEFDAPDQSPVDIVFLLLVPEEAQQEHLNILAGLARLLSQQNFCERLRSAQSRDDLYSAAIAFQD